MPLNKTQQDICSECVLLDRVRAYCIKEPLKVVPTNIHVCDSLVVFTEHIIPVTIQKLANTVGLDGRCFPSHLVALVIGLLQEPQLAENPIQPRPSWDKITGIDRDYLAC